MTSTGGAVAEAAGGGGGAAAAVEIMLFRSHDLKLESEIRQ